MSPDSICPTVVSLYGTTKFQIALIARQTRLRKRTVEMTYGVQGLDMKVWNGPGPNAPLEKLLSWNKTVSAKTFHGASRARDHRHRQRKGMCDGCIMGK